VSRDHIEILFGSIVVGFGLGRQHVADGAKQGVVVEPVDPFEHGHFDGRRSRPRSLPTEGTRLASARR
jgi:hypothetical protein